MEPRARASSEYLKQLWWRVKVQRVFGFIFFIPFNGFLLFLQRYVLGYKVENVRECRAMYAEVTRDRTPLVICSNHMTYLDSSILIYAFANAFRYGFNFRLLTWNLPAIEYSKNPFFLVVGFLSKCLFIDRKGFSKHHAFFATCVRLLNQGEPVMIFPEGRRSRTGRFDDRKLAYGVGKIISQISTTRVLCTYLRPKGQDEFSGFPKLRSTFHVHFKILTVHATDESRETVERVTKEIAACIKSLETDYFKSIAERGST